MNGSKNSVKEHSRNPTGLSKKMEGGNKAETKPSKSSAQHDKNKQRVSVRFQLHLSDSTDRSFPEFSYMELMGTANVSLTTYTTITNFGPMFKFFRLWIYHFDTHRKTRKRRKMFYHKTKTAIWRK